jgi:hypothetical protein
MNSLIEAYKNTKYIVFEPTLIIEIGKLNQEIDDIIINHNSNSWAFITAYNPFSRILTNDENRLRHDELKELTKDYITFEGHGVGENPTWEPELSLLIIGISKDDASKIGKEFEQNAIVYGLINETPQLLILNQELN